MRMTRRVVLHGLTGVAAGAALGGMARAADGSTVRIGMVLPVTGPGADAGRYALNGAKLALAAVNKDGGVLGQADGDRHRGRPDHQSRRGARLQQARLRPRHCRLHRLDPLHPGPRHGARHAQEASPVLRRHRPAADPPGNPWLFRFRPNDSYSARDRRLSACRRSATKNWRYLLDGCFRHRQGAKSRRRAGRPSPRSTSTMATPTRSQDFTPVVLAIRQSGADVISCYFTFETDLGIFASQAAPARRPHPLGGLALDHQRLGAQARRARRSTTPMASPTSPKIQARPSKSFATPIGDTFQL